MPERQRTLRAAIRRQLGLPPLDHGKVLDVSALARAASIPPSISASDDEDVAAHHRDDKMRVLLTAKELDKRLKTISERYRGHVRETGLHTLFVVLGFVQWFEDGARDTPLHAPEMVLWKDLDLAAWPAAAFAEHRFLPGLPGDRHHRGRPRPAKRSISMRPNGPPAPRR